ncbi:hypothetical protein [Agromyces albus]|uniref:hypothetical protein n=1 Tax=Agromyces albus TaxID=205332 RepID=UPI00278A11C2|nr:hypothetical protein [Agromyces albus]MDQ0577639.1 hypothetical protein [Agromyces albus]
MDPECGSEHTGPVSTWTGASAPTSGRWAYANAVNAALLLPVKGDGAMTRRSATHGVGWLKGTVGALGASALMVMMLASPAAADPPTPDSGLISFPDVNPCTGETHTVTIELTFYQHDHGDGFIERGVSSVTTSSGFEGGGTSTIVETEGAFVFRLVDVLSDEAGSRIMARTIFIVDPATGAVRVDRSDLTCIHAAG